MNNTNDCYDLNQKILTEQFKALYKTTLPNMISTLVVGGELVYGLWNKTAHNILLTWLSLLLLAMTTRLIHYYFFRKFNHQKNLPQHKIFNIISSLSFGLIWGIGVAIIAQPLAFEYQTLLFFVVAGMAAGALASLTYYLPTFLFFLPLAVLPISVTFFLVGDTAHLLLSFMPFIYVAGLTIYSVEINRTFKESLSLRFQNMLLIEQLREQKAIADNANQAKSKFLAEASHDLRQPLYALMLFTSTLDGCITDKKTKGVVAQIKISVETLQNLFNNLLDISRYEVGAMKAEKINFCLSPLLTQLANDINPQAHAKGLHIHWPETSAVIFSDPILITQILRNYLSNAIRYTANGTITVHCETHEKTITLHVTDTGSGIDFKDQHIIFDEFNQLVNPTRDNNQGLGLGLAIVKRIATLLNHPINVQSHPGKGSTFSVTLDIGDSTEIYTDAHHRIIKDIEDNNINAFIVVIDDEESIRKGTQILLESWGCHVVTAASLTEACAQLNELNVKPDGIIADYQLAKDQTGIEAAQAIHDEWNSYIPTLIVTGSLGFERTPIVISSGFQILRKPVSPLKLRTFVRNAALRRAQQLQLTK